MGTDGAEPLARELQRRELRRLGQPRRREDVVGREGIGASAALRHVRPLRPATGAAGEPLAMAPRGGIRTRWAWALTCSTVTTRCGETSIAPAL